MAREIPFRLPDRMSATCLKTVRLLTWMLKQWWSCAGVVRWRRGSCKSRPADTSRDLVQVLLCSRAVFHLRSRSIHKSKSLDLMSCSKECGSTRRRGTLGIVLARAQVRALLIERRAGNENGIGKLRSDTGGNDSGAGQLC